MAPSVTPEDAARHLERLAEERRLLGRDRERRFRARVPEAAALLSGRFGAERALLFGSLRHGRSCQRDQ